MQTSVLNLLLDGTADLLRDHLLTQVDDDSKAGLVRTGKLQDDPTSRRVNILIHPGGEEWQDKINTDGSSAGKYVDNAYTIGGDYGGVYWRRRVKAELQMFFTNEASRDTARIKAHVVLSRALNALLTWDVGKQIPQDSFGEKVYDLQITGSWLREGGGEGDFNWRGEMRIEFLTEINALET